MKIYLKKALASLAVLAMPYTALAEDIDLFLGFPTSGVEAPNVLFIIDNTGNWSAPFEGEMKAFEAVFNTLIPSIIQGDIDINVGMMLFTETGGDDNNVDGGYVRAAIRSMASTNSDGVPHYELYADMIASYDEDGERIGGFHERDDRSNSGKAGLAMAEAYHYFASLAPEAGNNKAKTDYGNAADGPNTYFNHSNPSRATCCVESHPVWELPGNALTSKAGTLYNGPVAPGECGKNYIIWVSNGAAQDAASDNVRANELLSAQGGDTTQISLNPAGSSDVVADEWARFMRKQSGLEITTFTLDINPVDTGQGPGWSALLESMADESDGEYYRIEADDPACNSDTDQCIADQVTEAIASAFSRILGVNSVFASVALPASANTQSTFLNQVFIGLFRPDEDAKPRWFGNLKQYKLGFDDGNTLRLLDPNDVPVVDPATGFIEECAYSYWTPSSPDTYWSFLSDSEQRGECSSRDSVAVTSASNFPDGPIVEKGGQAYVGRSANSRTVYTCSSDIATCDATTSLPRLDLDYNLISDTALDANDPTDGDELIKWAIGWDVDGELDPNSPPPSLSATAMRPSLHGDVVHSRPVALNYGTDANPETVVFYGANDGMLRAVNGNRNAAQGTVAAGEEFWAFMPPEFYGKVKRLRENDLLINFPASGPYASVAGAAKPYGMDGPLTAFEGVVDATDKKFLYAGLRRAGRVLYAFDITNKSTPTLKWKKGCPNLDNDTDCTTGWTDIGQTWSTPSVTHAQGYTDISDNSLKPLLLMGGGYDGCDDFDNGSTANHNCSSTNKGDVIYLLDADDGSIIKTFATDRAVAGGITVVPVSDGDQRILYAYAADTGGNIYRISGGTADAPDIIGSTVPADWIMTKIASLGCGPDATTTCTANRKFLFAPDVIRIPLTDKFGLLVGSGDREKPIRDYGAAVNVQNYFFSIVDQPSNADWLDDDDDATCGDDIICLDALTEVATGDSFDPDLVVSAKGWKLPLASDEQVVTGAITVADVVNFSTHIPHDPNEVLANLTDPDDRTTWREACRSNLGIATSYNINYSNAQGEPVNITGGGLVPTPVAGKVILDDGSIVPFCIGCGGEGSPIGGSQVGSGITWIQPKSRVYWNIKQ